MDGREISLLPGADKKESKNTQSMKGSVQVTLRGKEPRMGTNALTQQLHHFDQVSQLLYISIILWRPVFLIWDGPQAHVWTHSRLSQFRGEAPTGIWRVETRGAAKLPTVLRTVPTTKSNLAPKVSSAETETPRHGGDRCLY